MHLGVALSGAGYFCYRNPSRHSGKSLPYLLHKLGVASVEVDRLLAKHTSREKKDDVGIRDDTQQSKQLAGFAAVQKQWDTFEPASTSQHCVDYLYERGFEDAAGVADAYDLRAGRVGRWSQRLLLPYYTNGGVVSWTGRTLRNQDPKYLANHVDGSSLLLNYLRRSSYQVGVVTEGPLDALKITEAGKTMGIHAAALSGKSLTTGKQVQLLNFFKSCTTCFLALDADVPMSEVMHTIAALAPLTPKRRIRRLPLPMDRKDPGEMPIQEIQEWLTNALSNQQ